LIITFSNKFQVYDDSKTLIYGSNDGRTLDQTYVEETANAVYDAFQDVGESVKCEDSSADKCLSLGPILQTQYDQLLAEYGQENKTLFDAIYQGVIDEERIDYALDNFSELGQCGYAEFVDLKGNQNTNTKNGYIQLIEILSANLSGYQINLNEKVTKIDYSNSDKVNILTDKNRTFSADFVLSTMSLGVLKRNYTKMFNPALPIEKQASLDKLGFGTVNKVFLVFDAPVFTDPSDGGFQLFWPSDLPSLDAKYSLNVS
jgi:spermine oxidase